MFIKRAANAQNESWRWILGFIAIFVGCQVFGAFPFVLALIVKTIQDGGNSMMLDESSMMQVFSPNTTLFLLMLTFVIGTIVWYLWIKYVHKLNWHEATTSRSKFDWSRAWFAFAVVGIVSIVLTAVGYYLEPEIFIWNYQPDKFWILVIIAVALVPIQTTWEELYFRSYMMQGLGLMAGNRAVPYIVTSVIFGMMHIFNPEVAKLGYVVMFWYVGTGFLLGTFTLMDEGTELAIGFHAANNLFIALLVTADWTAFQTDSLLIDISDPEATFTTFLPLLMYYPLLILLFSWKYKWSNWKERLLGPVHLDKPVEDPEFEQLN
ncbi:CPBP family intramembrane glutamic endopeptidase [Nonlabens ponticola]|uniref:CPBP family intramembrane metalloprotease n=1 Tax=Nonlabens ponticola TaxID=2496866 RepID=A0A3S9MXZ1_9FLAO|nr:CPBP family intramembrane glutamic endopeptidase [Nonlabens ponticola]AZQ44002.1 CPBP family intramembrane metalloprotease [Nonlabens ponticola]